MKGVILAGGSGSRLAPLWSVGDPILSARDAAVRQEAAP